MGGALGEGVSPYPLKGSQELLFIQNIFLKRLKRFIDKNLSSDLSGG
jgi:hypothetical protein